MRKAKSFSDLGKAERAAAAIARKLHKGESLMVQLRGSDCTAYLQAKAALGPIQVRLDLAAHEYRLCQDLLAGRASIVEAVRHFADTKTEPVTPKPVPEILKELLAKDCRLRPSRAWQTAHRSPALLPPPAVKSIRFPLWADVRAASRISVTIRFTSKDDSPDGRMSPRTTAPK